MSKRNHMLSRALRGAILAGAAAVILTGCASFPENHGSLPDARDEIQSRQDSWSETREAVTRIEGMAELTTRRQYSVPDDLAETPIQFELTSAATLSDLAAILEHHNLPTIIASKSTSSQSGGRSGASQASDGSLANEKAGIIRFNGTLGELIELLRDLRNLEVEYRGRHLVIREDALYFMTAPQHKELIEQIAKSISDLGGKDVRSDLNAGLVAYRASPEQASDIERYVQRIAANAAIVHLQVAIINVRINGEQRRGFDWNEVAVRIGELANASVETFGEGVVLTNRGASYAKNGSDLSVTAALMALSQYGDARADQDITLSTLAGNAVEIQSGKEIPYVGSIGTTLVAQTGSSSSASVETLNAGLELTLEPLYDAKANLVTTSIDLSLTEMLKMHEFPIPGRDGEIGGSLSHPELQVLSFTNIARLRPGEAALMGGVSFNQEGRDYSSVLGLENVKAGSRNIRSEKHALFILLRPTVTLFGNPDQAMTAAKTEAKAEVNTEPARTAETVVHEEPKRVSIDPGKPINAQWATVENPEAPLWGVQVAAYRDPATAYRVAESMQYMGYRVDNYENEAGLHVIRLSGIKSEEEANLIRDQINAVGYQSIVVHGSPR